MTSLSTKCLHTFNVCRFDLRLRQMHNTVCVEKDDVFLSLYDNCVCYARYLKSFKF